MGCSSGKPPHGEDRIDPQRRRLSTSTGGQQAKEPGADTEPDDSTLDDLLKVLKGPTERKLSASTVQSPMGFQAAYADKKVQLKGNSMQRRLGYICKKGLKP